MMMLCIDGSDIRRLTVEVYEWEDGMFSGNGWRNTRGGTFDVGPEAYLATIATLVKPEDVDGIVIVQGPGSATSLRASLAIANTLAMTKQIPLYGIAKGDAWESVLTSDGPKNGVGYLAPVYEHEPRITPSGKDTLGRIAT